jgi:hypothetical protein
MKSDDEVNTTLNQQRTDSAGGRLNCRSAPPPAIELIAGSLHFPIFLMILYFLREMHRFQRPPLSQMKHSIKGIGRAHIYFKQKIGLTF